MSKNQGKGSRFLDFMAGKGFYVVLFVCVSAIAVSGYMLLWGGTEEQPTENMALKGEPTQGAPVWTMPPVTQKPASTQAPTPAPTPRPAPPSRDVSGIGPDDGAVAEVGKTGIGLPVAAPTSAPTPESTPAPTPLPTEKPRLSFNWPVPRSDSSLWVFAPDRLAESPLGDFRTHTGVDLSTEEGSSVFAAAPGTVAACYTDKQYGFVVEIIHDDGYVTRYGNLSDEQNVVEGQNVNAGEAIGTIGKTAVSETTLASHLHFEILQNETYVDPFTLLP